MFSDINPESYYDPEVDRTYYSKERIKQAFDRLAKDLPVIQAWWYNFSAYLEYRYEVRKPNMLSGPFAVIDREVEMKSNRSPDPDAVVCWADSYEGANRIQTLLEAERWRK